MKLWFESRKELSKRNQSKKKANNKVYIYDNVKNCYFGKITI